MPPPRRKLTSYVDAEDDDAMRRIEKHSGVIRSEQIRRGIKLWIQSRPKKEWAVGGNGNGK